MPLFPPADGTAPGSPEGRHGHDSRQTGPAEGDGRNISGDLGLLAGEGAGQKTPEHRAGSEGKVPVWSGPARGSSDRSPTYYERSVLKEPVWIWAVPAYFFCGGAAGAAAVLGEAARLIGAEDLRPLSGRCRWIAAGGTSVGAVLLIYDLGRPERFFNMLRVFRPTSVMSMGSWTLAASGALSAAAAALTPRAGARPTRLLAKKQAAADLAAAGSAALGLPLAAYTAVLLSDTAVPFWQQARKTLPALFVSSAAASAAALLKLARPDEASSEVVRRYGIAGTLAESAAAYAVEKEAKRVERVARALEHGLPANLWKGSKVLSTVSLALALAERGSRARQIGSAVSGVAGGLALRFAVFHAGKESARDPRASFEQQRSQSQNTATEHQPG